MKLDSVRKINHIPLAIGSFLVFLLGLVFLILTFTVIIPNSNNKGVQVQATIQNIVEHENRNEKGEIENYDYEVYLHYEYEGEPYSSMTKNYDSSMSIGKNITINIDPNNPEIILDDGSFGIIFGIISGVFAVTGLIATTYNVKKLVDMKNRREE